MSKNQEAEELFKKLSQAYSSPYFPSPEEKKEAIFLLISLLHGKIDKGILVNKIKAFAVLHGDHKTKVSNLIINRFWEQNIEFGVQARKFKDED